jgi:hypothetical protein
VDRAYKPNFRVHPLGSLKKMKFLIRGLGVLLGAVLAGWLYFYASDHIKIIQLDSIFDPAYGYPQGYREEYFAKTFPSSSDIESYLSNATLLISKPPLGNVIYYFDEYRHFTLWHDNIVEGGEWWLILNCRCSGLANNGALLSFNLFAGPFRGCWPTRRRTIATALRASILCQVAEPVRAANTARETSLASLLSVPRRFSFQARKYR